MREGWDWDGDGNGDGEDNQGGKRGKRKEDGESRRVEERKGGGLGVVKFYGTVSKYS